MELTKERIEAICNFELNWNNADKEERRALCDLALSASEARRLLGEAQVHVCRSKSDLHNRIDSFLSQGQKS